MIQGKTVGIRLLEPEDLELLAHWRNADATRSTLFTPLLVPVAGQRAWYDRVLGDPSSLLFTFVRLADGRPVGSMGLRYIDHRAQCAAAWYHLVDPAERKQGYGSEGTALVVDYAFQELNLQRVYGLVSAENPAAERQLLRDGFQKEGIARKAIFSGGRFHDGYYFAVLRDEWPRRA